MNRKSPEWFALTNQATRQVMARIADATSGSAMALQVRQAPTLAHWFMLDSLLLANNANREGMHANALSLTRQCLESLTVVELGICGHRDAESVLLKWEADQLAPGKLRAWLENHVWPRYGNGLWGEPWRTFMREFSGALQPYAHYSSRLAQWQMRLLRGAVGDDKSSGDVTAIIEMRPRGYDPQKATRITLFHALLTYVLGRIWLAREHASDPAFSELIGRFGAALGKSKYLDGHATDWGQQFWAVLWDSDGGTVLE